MMYEEEVYQKPPALNLLMQSYFIELKQKREIGKQNLFFWYPAKI
jgi:hypothetical protein